MTKLAELVADLPRLDDALTIYSARDREWAADSEAIAIQAPEDGSLPAEAVGFVYLLEVDQAKEVLEVWSEWRGGRTPTLAECVEAIVYYAVNDAYLEPE
jgi:hypothetical protein